MCEQLVARAASPFRLDELWPLVSAMERYGLAGFGWGAAWLAADGTIHHHRAVAAFRDDEARGAVGRHETTSLLVHLRRPSRLSTIQLPDTQPFVDPAGRFAFTHNGELERWRAPRDRYRAEGRIEGRADSEVGQRWLEDAWAHHDDASGALAGLHQAFGGEANLAALARDGSCRHYAGNPENPVFAYRLGRIGVASTGIYSIDRSLFRFAAPGATDRHVVRPATIVALDERGAAVGAGIPRRVPAGATPG